MPKHPLFRLELSPRFIPAGFDAAVVLPAVQHHTDGGGFHGLVLARTELEQVASGELVGQQGEK